jgi:hypothetical protein
MRKMPNNQPELMRALAAIYFQLAGMTKIPELGETLRARGRALGSCAALAEEHADPLEWTETDPT